LEGESDYYDENSVESYRAEMCPSGNDNSQSGSNSNDNSYWEDGAENENYADYSDQVCCVVLCCVVLCCLYGY